MVLNSKKAKLRELRDRLSKQPAEEEEKEESTDRTESFDERSDNEEIASSSKDAPTSKPRGRKRK